jgi:hypothetical protein
LLLLEVGALCAAGALDGILNLEHCNGTVSLAVLVKSASRKKASNHCSRAWRSETKPAFQVPTPSWLACLEATSICGAPKEEAQKMV